MKILRLLLLAVTALAVLLAAAAFLALNSRVQTWAARRVLAAQAEPQVTVGSVAAGLHAVAVRDLRAEFRGAVLSLPSLEADLPLASAGLSERVLVTRLVARGWTLDLSHASRLSELLRAPPAAKVARSRGEFSPLPTALAADVTPVVAEIFQGIFSRITLPVDLALDGVVLEGEIILPAARGQARVTLRGGGLAAGREGRFELMATTVLTDATVSTLDSHAVLRVAMDTPRTLSKLDVSAGATASGAGFPHGAKLAAEAAASRTVQGEKYSASLITEKKQLLALEASLPASARKINGLWKVDAGDADLAPFCLRHPLPVFAAEGAGRIELDPATSETRLNGKLAVKTENLTAIEPRLAALGRTRFETEFDLTQVGDVTRVEKLTASIFGERPVAKVESLQTLEFNRGTRALKVLDPSRDLLALDLQGLPLVWLQPWLPALAIAGGDVRGEFFALASEGGFSLRSKSPLVASGISLTAPGRPLVRGVGVSLSAAFDYTPRGWQASISPLAVSAGGAPLLTLEAKAGQLAGVDQPIKTTGKYAINLPALLAQPAAAGMLELKRGDATGGFAAQLGRTREFQATLALANLAADPLRSAERLPSIGVEVRADLAADGQVAFNLPVLVGRDGRKSDVTLAGTIRPAQSGFTIAARVNSSRLVVQDFRILAAPLVADGAGAVAGEASAPKAASGQATKAPWDAISGELALSLQEVVWSDSFRASKVNGTLRLDRSAVMLEQLRAGLGEGGEAKLAGTLAFDAKSAANFTLTSELSVSDFDPAPLFRALDPSRPATVEGKFNVTSKLAGRASTLAGLAEAVHGDFQLSSRGGVFRGLPVSAASRIESAGKLAAGAAFLGSLAGAVTGRKEYAEIGNRAQALSEVTKIWQAVAYDQLGVAISRDESLNTVLKDFTLISPELRLTGAGRVTHVAGRPLLTDALAMEFKLRARGHHGDVLKYLGVLESATDELGYAGCTLPIKVGGTIESPDTTELNRALASLALDKSGATDLLNKLLGGK